MARKPHHWGHPNESWDPAVLANARIHKQAAIYENFPRLPHLGHFYSFFLGQLCVSSHLQLRTVCVFSKNTLRCCTSFQKRPTTNRQQLKTNRKQYSKKQAGARAQSPTSTILIPERSANIETIYFCFICIFCCFKMCIVIKIRQLWEPSVARQGFYFSLFVCDIFCLLSCALCLYLALLRNQWVKQVSSIPLA